MDGVTSRFYICKSLDPLDEFSVEDDIRAFSIGFSCLLHEQLLYTLCVYRV